MIGDEHDRRDIGTHTLFYKAQMTAEEEWGICRNFLVDLEIRCFRWNDLHGWSLGLTQRMIATIASRMARGITDQFASTSFRWSSIMTCALLCPDVSSACEARCEG